MKTTQKTWLNFVVPGFMFGGFSAGLKADAQKKDVGLIFCDSPQVTASAVFTKNRVCAAPVLLSQKNIQKGHARLVVVNSGNANAATGKSGLLRAQKILKSAAKIFSVKESDVLVASTGKIGVPLPDEKIISALNQNAQGLSATSGDDFLQAIMTTDAYPKGVVYKGKLAGRDFRIAIYAKGAGMISPDMATMLCFIVTDLKFEKAALKKILKVSVDQTLNCMTVDGDTSTNDSVFMLASGLANSAAIKANSKEFKTIQKILTALLKDITFQIVRDGEGATKVCEIQVTGAKSLPDAKRVARTIGNSPLVKTALFGNDPNWGRIAAATGRAGAYVVPEKLSIRIGKNVLYKRGKVFSQNESLANTYLKTHDHVVLAVDLGVGAQSATIYASDLTYDYIKCNAEYST